MNDRTYVLYAYLDPNPNEVTGDYEPVIRVTADQDVYRKFVKAGYGVYKPIRIAVSDGEACLIQRAYDEDEEDFVDQFVPLKELRTGE